MEKRHGQALAVLLQHVEIERGCPIEPRLRLYALNQGHPLAGDEVLYRDGTRPELREVDAQPVGERGIDVEYLSAAAGGEEPRGRVVEIVDRVLQFLEEALLVLPLGSDVRQLPGLERLSAPSLDRQKPGAEPVPARSSFGRRKVERPKQAEFFLSLVAVAQNVREAVDGLRGFLELRQHCLDGLHVLGFRRSGKLAIGAVRVDDAILVVGDQGAFLVTVQERARQRIGGRPRHDLYEAYDRRNEEEDAHHRQDAEQAKDDLAVETVLVEDEKRRRSDEHDRQEDEPKDGPRLRAAIDDRRRIRAGSISLGHRSPHSSHEPTGARSGCDETSDQAIRTRSRRRFRYEPHELSSLQPQLAAPPPAPTFFPFSLPISHRKDAENCATAPKNALKGTYAGHARKDRRGRNANREDESCSQT